MRFNIIDTQAVYRRWLAEPDAAQCEAIFRAELLAPYEAMFRVFGGSDPLAIAAQWALYLPESFATEHPDSEVARLILDRLAAANAWEKATQALAEAQHAFAPFAVQIPVDSIQFGIFLADSRRALAMIVVIPGLAAFRVISCSCTAIRTTTTCPA
jgi:hypothetical protein